MVFLTLSLALACLFDGGHTAQWTASSPQDGHTMYICTSGSLTIAWGYTLSPGDVLGYIEWYCDGTSHKMLAFSTHGIFLPLPDFANRVEAVGNAGMKLTNLTVGDSGNYSVQVHVTSGSSLSVLSRSLYVQVNDLLMTQDGSLHASQSPEAVLDTSTDQWAIQLQCGVFTYPGAPPFSLVWITPSGKNLTSSHFSDGHFNLLLKSPLQGGNYTCRVPPHLAHDVCLHDNAAHQGEATVHVDKMYARLSLLEKENEQLKSELRKIKSELTQETSNLSSELSQVKSSLSSELSQVNSELSHVNSDLSRVQADLQTCIQTIDDRTRPTVGFHARNLQTDNPSRDSPFIFIKVVYNGGHAYNKSTGYFTAPYPGLYVFMATTGPHGSDRHCYHELVVESTCISRAFAYSSPKSNNYLNLSTAHAVVHLTTGQKVWVKSFRSFRYYSEYSSFSGALVSHLPPEVATAPSVDSFRSQLQSSPPSPCSCHNTPTLSSPSLFLTPQSPSSFLPPSPPPIVLSMSSQSPSARKPPVPESST